MRALLLAVGALTLITAASAQTPPAPPSTTAYRAPDLAAQRTAMERLAPLIGEWTGEANVTFPEPSLVHQREQVTREVDGLAMIIRGTGYANAAHTGARVFEAMAVISYDERRGLYDFRTYNSGHTANATGEFLPDGAFRWSMGAGPMRMRYTIRFDANTWTEIGEASRDGGMTYTRTIEMNLRRVPPS